MNRHSKCNKLISIILSVILMVSCPLTICLAATQTVTTTYECGKLFCSNNLICVGPIGKWDTIPSSVPYIGGTTLYNSTILEEEYNDTIAASQKDWDDVTYEEHIYVVYCPDYDNSNLIDHTMIVYFVAHRIGYSNPIYSKGSASAHSYSYPCYGSTTSSYDRTVNLGKSLSSSKEDEIYETYIKNQTDRCSMTFSGGSQAHTFSYTDWTSSDDTYHQRTKSCSICGYSATVSENHSLDYGDWNSISSLQHERSVNCEICGYSSTETEKHSFVITDYTSLNDNQHTYKKTCSVCGYSETVTESHTLSYGNWSCYDENQHCRTKSCSICGYSELDYAEHKDEDGDSLCDDCLYTITVFSVTVPASMDITMDKDGNVYSADNVKIYNNSTDAVKVNSISLVPENDWTVVSYSTNMANEKVNCKKIGFKICEATTTSDTEMTMNGDWSIESGESMDLDYDAKISATTESITGEKIMDVIFVIDWSDD